MTVLYLFHSIANWGGIERILVDKMNYLADKYDLDVYLLTTDQGHNPIPFDLSSSIMYEDLGIFFYRKYRYHGFKRFLIARKMLFEYEKLLKERLIKINPDIIICTTTDHINSIAKYKGNTPLIVESHSICSRTINGGKKWLLRKFYREKFLHSLSKVEVLVALTEGDAQEWRKYHHNVCVIPNFVHQHKFSVSGQDKKNVIVVGRFDYQKRVQDAIQIWRLVRERHPDWIMNIYGEGDMIEEIKKLASTVGNIVIHPPTSHIIQAYCDNSLLMMTSLFEPFGLVMLEAMSCGLPVIAFDCPYGPSDIITDGKNGFLIKERNFVDYTNKVCMLMENRNLRVEMGKNGMLSSHNFSPKHVMPLWKELFDKLLVN